MTRARSASGSTWCEAGKSTSDSMPPAWAGVEARDDAGAGAGGGSAAASACAPSDVSRVRWTMRTGPSEPSGPSAVASSTATGCSSPIGWIVSRWRISGASRPDLVDVSPSGATVNSPRGGGPLTPARWTYLQAHTVASALSGVHAALNALRAVGRLCVAWRWGVLQAAELREQQRQRRVVAAGREAEGGSLVRLGHAQAVDAPDACMPRARA